jgi:hypothetical protein
VEVIISKYFINVLCIANYDWIGGRSSVGATEIIDDNSGRYLHWEAAGGVVCLREICREKTLVDCAICFQLGGMK